MIFDKLYQYFTCIGLDVFLKYIKESIYVYFFIYCLQVYIASRPRASNQSEFELNIEKKMTEIFFDLYNSLNHRRFMRGLRSILSLFCNEFNKFNNTRA